MPGELSNRIAQIVVDRAKFAADLQLLPAPARKYAILFISRSGSTWLADLLSRQNVLGTPREYLNLDMIARFGAEFNANTLTDYFAMLVRRRSTANGVFGLKIGWAQLGLLIEEGVAQELLAGFRWIYLRRRNLVAQAVSLYKARTSGAYQRRLNDSAELRLGHDRADAQVAYDGDAIGRYMAEIIAGEEAAEAMIAGWKLSPLRMVYEDMLAGNPASAVDAVHRLVFDGMPAAGPFKPSNIERSGTPRNLVFENRFRKEHRQAIETLERRRRALAYRLP